MFVNFCCRAEWLSDASIYSFSCSVMVYHPPLLSVTISAVVFTYWLPFPSFILQYESEFQYGNKLALGLSCWSNDWDAELSMQGAQVRSLVGELGSHMLHGTVGKKEDSYWAFSSLFILTQIFILPYSFMFFTLIIYFLPQIVSILVAVI